MRVPSKTQEWTLVRGAVCDWDAWRGPGRDFGPAPATAAWSSETGAFALTIFEFECRAALESYWKVEQFKAGKT